LKHEIRRGHAEALTVTVFRDLQRTIAMRAAESLFSRQPSEISFTNNLEKKSETQSQRMFSSASFFRFAGFLLGFFFYDWFCVVGIESRREVSRFCFLRTSLPVIAKVLNASVDERVLCCHVAVDDCGKRFPDVDASVIAILLHSSIDCRVTLRRGSAVGNGIDVCCERFPVVSDWRAVVDDQEI
jgi:hypothetical protein